MTNEEWNQIGAQLAEQGAFKSAAECFKKAIDLDESRADIRANYADILRRLWRFEESHQEIDRTLEKGPFEKATFIAGCLALDKGDSAKALTYLTRQSCTMPYPRFVRSQALLHAGQYAEGWEELESRLDMLPPSHPPVPVWKGEDLTGKTVAIHHEQGYGDTLAYSRFLRALGPRAILGLPSPLVRLFEGLLGVPVVNTNQPLPKVDYYLPLMSLPHRLGITTPTAKPYLKAKTRFDIQRTGAKLKIGLVWRSKSGPESGNVAVDLHGNQKSIPFSLFLPLTSIKGVQFYGLQTGESQGDIAKNGAQSLVYDLGAKAQDFDEIASFMQEMDLIVSVDTAPLHLAGAMGLNTLGLLSCRGGWPFPGLGETTPWYGTMRLIRQKTPHDWSTVIEELRQHIESLL